MGHKKRELEDFAIALKKEAEKELERAKERFKNKDYPDAVFHSQQCVEKIVKSLLEMEGLIVRKHKVKDIFDRITKLKEVSRAIYWFEKDRKWVKTRYPTKIGKRVYLPEEIFTKEIAQDALKKANFVFKKICEILREKYKVKV
jgi:HEPN domain-containing protein